MSKRNNFSENIILSENAKIINNQKEISEIMNDYYNNAAKDIGQNQNIDVTEHPSIIEIKKHSEGNNFQFHHTTREDVLKIPKTLNPKKATGCDQIPAKLLKHASLQIAPVISIIINKALDEGTLKHSEGNNFQFHHTTREDVLKILKTPNPKKATGCDQIPTKLLKHASLQIAPVISIIINKALDEGTLKHSDGNNFQFHHTTREDVLKILKTPNPKKATGCDQIPTKLLKHASLQIAPVISIIINKALDEGTFQNNLTKAEVIPVYKKSDKLNL